MKNRQFRITGILFLVMVLVGVLTACGSKPANDDATGAAPAANASEQAAESPDAASASPSANGETAAETVPYTDANGEQMIPGDPQRIVVLADSYVGYFLALGIKPVGVTQSALENPYFKGKVDGIENVGDGTTASNEKILTLSPDLIIDWSGTDNLENLKKIAPTISIDYGKLTMREQLREFGKITNRADKADEWIAQWDQRIADSKTAVEAAVGAGTVSILSPYAKGIYAFGHNYGRGGEILYGEFKLQAPPIIQQEAIGSGTGWASLSLEKLPEYAGDYIFTAPWSGDSADPDTVYGSSLWKGLPAVRNDRVFELDPIGAYYNDPVSLEAQLDFIVKSLTQNAQ